MSENQANTQEQIRLQKIKQLQEDQDLDWWRAKEIDDFNIRNKLIRVGCRPLKRKYLACVKKDTLDVQDFAECKRLRNDLDECYKALHFLQMQMAQENIDKSL